MKNDIYWLWVQNVLGASSRWAAHITAMNGGARYLHSLTYDGIRAELPRLIDRHINRLCDKDLGGATRILEKVRRDGGFVITPEDSEYYDALRHLSSPPLCLFAKGKLPPFDTLRVAIVGSRKATDFGMKSARELARRLALAHAVVVSGGAAGIDTCAHEGCLEGAGKTISILGCGLDHPYNTQGADLRERIINQGALVSEYPPGSPPLGYHFPQRNRLIAGFSKAVVVGQSGKRSGSLITAGLAGEQGVQVYVINEMDGKDSTAGSLKTLEDGATPITRADELLCDFMRMTPSERQPFTTLGNFNVYNNKTDTDDYNQNYADPVGTGLAPVPTNTPKSHLNLNQKTVDLAEFSLDAGKIYGILTTTAVTVAEIESASELPPGSIFAALTELEIFGAIESLPGKRYKRK